MRIVSLLPAATETVFELGWGDFLVGRSHACDWPPQVENVPAVTKSRLAADLSSNEIDSQVSSASGPLFELDEQLILDLRPTLILTQGLCAVCAIDAVAVAQVAKRLGADCRVETFAPTDLSAVTAMVERIGDVCECSGASLPQRAGHTRATELVAQLGTRAQLVQERAQRISQPRTLLFLEWLDPPFSAGHWNPRLIRMAGARNALGDATEAKSNRLTIERVLSCHPDLVVVASCGYSQEQVSRELQGVEAEWLTDWCQSRQVPVWAADGNRLFNRPGPSLWLSLEVLAHVVSPAVHPAPVDFSRWARQVV